MDYIIYAEGYEKDDIVFETYWRERELETSFSDSLNIEVSIPSGNTGRHGVYIILENFIRDSIMNGKKKAERGDKIQFRITLSSADEDFLLRKNQPTLK